MAQNLLKKTIFIVVIIIACVFGVVGIPTGWQAMLRNAQEHIHLGLDLRGGTHLVLQVMVNDAINSEADQTIELLQDVFKKKGITYGAMTRIDAVGIHDEGGILVQGVPDEQTSALRQAIDENEPNWT